MADFACRNPPSRIFVNIYALIPYDTSNCSQHNKLHLCAKIDVNGPIFIKLWPGEVRGCDVMFSSQNSPGHNFVNIGPLTSVVSLKCSSLCRLSWGQDHIKNLYRTLRHWRDGLCHGSFLLLVTVASSSRVVFPSVFKRADVHGN